jgi:hypothetical protein
MTTEKTSFSGLITRNEGIVSSKLKDEVVMLDIEQGKYFGLDPVAARIWEIIETPSSVQSILDTILAEYDVDADVCRQDVDEFLIQMNDLRMIETSRS